MSDSKNAAWQEVQPTASVVCLDRCEKCGESVCPVADMPGMVCCNICDHLQAVATQPAAVAETQSEQSNYDQVLSVLRRLEDYGLFDVEGTECCDDFVDLKRTAKKLLKKLAETTHQGAIAGNYSKDRKFGDCHPETGKHTAGEWKYGVRADGSIWLSIGNHREGPHYQGDMVASEDDAKLIVASPRMRFVLKRLLNIHGQPHEYSGNRPEEWTQAAELLATIDR